MIVQAHGSVTDFTQTLLLSGMIMTITRRGRVTNTTDFRDSSNWRHWLDRRPA